MEKQQKLTYSMQSLLRYYGLIGAAAAAAAAIMAQNQYVLCA